MLTVGLMAKHYHVLPSIVAAEATTYDLQVFNSLMAWEQEQEQRAQGKKTAPKLSQEYMQAMIDRVKEKQNVINSKKAG
jgi:hypothetical protein